MRWTAIGGALVLVAISWCACWQEIQIVRLRRQLGAATASLQASRAGEDALSQRLDAADRALADSRLALMAADRAAVKMDELRNLLTERRQALADARDAAHALRIRDGSAEMRAAVALATEDLDAEIIALAGPDAADALGIGPAALPASYPGPAPAPFLPQPDGPSPAVVETNAPALPVEAVPGNAAYAADGGVAVAATGDVSVTQVAGAAVLGGGIGSFPVNGRLRRAATTLTPLQQLSAGAGIPMSNSQLGVIVATNPLLLEQEEQHPASSVVSFGRSVPGRGFHAVQ